MAFEEKYFCRYISLIDQTELSSCVYLVRYCIVIICIQGCDVINFEINLKFLIKPFCLHNQKVKTTISLSWERKELLRWNKKHISSFYLRAFIETKQIFLVGESLFSVFLLWNIHIKGLEAATRCVLWKKLLLKNSKNSQENMCRSLFFNKVAGLSTLFKKRPRQFIWILRNL